MLPTLDVTSNDEFQQKFQRMQYIWLSVSIVYEVVLLYYLFSSMPALLYDWRSLAGIILSVLIVGIYYFALRCQPTGWPLPLRFSLSVWGSVYVIIICLCFLNVAFVWYFYILLGISFSLFQSRRLILMVGVLTITLFAFQGLLTWPLGTDEVFSMLGEGIAIYTITFATMFSQYLIHERYERNRLLKKLAETHRELEEAHQRLAASVEQEQELAILKERTRLAREMHDTLGHALVLVLVKLEAAQKLRERDPLRCERELETSKEIIREGMKELRACIANLRSPSLEKESVCRAIRRFAQELGKRTGIQVRCDMALDVECLPEQVEETLWKVAQEILTNVEKHAGAHQVIIQLCKEAHTVVMRIEDDGIGVPEELYQLCDDGRIKCVSPEGHYGLSGVCERVESVGGRVSIRNVRQGDEHASGGSDLVLAALTGTVIEVALPL